MKSGIFALVCFGIVIALGMASASFGRPEARSSFALRALATVVLAGGLLALAGGSALLGSANTEEVNAVSAGLLYGLPLYLVLAVGLAVALGKAPQRRTSYNLFAGAFGLAAPLLVASLWLIL
jgi:hypothetical protein